MRYILAFLLFFGALQPAQAAWYKIETGKFIFYGTSVDALREDAMRLEQFDGLLRQMLSIPENPGEYKLSVYVVSGEADVRRVYGDGSKDVAGFYTVNEGGVLAVVPRGTGDFSDVILYHEYAHHLMLHHMAMRYPAWYIEGFAEFLSTTEFKADRAHIGLPAAHRAYQLALESTTPIKTLLSASVGEVRRENRGNFYGRAWLLTHFLTFNTERKGQLLTYLNAITSGKPLLAAAEAAFGDLDILQRDLTRYQNAAKLKYVNVPSVPPDMKTATVTQMEPAFGDTIRERVMLRRGTADNEREAIVRGLTAAATKYATSADIWTQLAEAKLDREDYGGAIAAADRAVSLEPKSARALLWKGTALVRQLADKGTEDPAAWKEARGWLIKANRADTEDPLTLFEYYRSFAAEGREPTPTAIAGLQKATEMIPQATGYRVAYAFELIKAGSYSLAADYLQPIANSPHGGESAAAFQGVVSTLRAAATDKTVKVSLDDVKRQLSGAGDPDPNDFLR